MEPPSQPPNNVRPDTSTGARGAENSERYGLEGSYGALQTGLERHSQRAKRRNSGLLGGSLAGPFVGPLELVCHCISPASPVR